MSSLKVFFNLTFGFSKFRQEFDDTNDEEELYSLGQGRWHVEDVQEEEVQQEVHQERQKERE